MNASHTLNSLKAPTFQSPINISPPISLPLPSSYSLHTPQLLIALSIFFLIIIFFKRHNWSKSKPKPKEPMHSTTPPLSKLTPRWVISTPFCPKWPSSVSHFYLSVPNPSVSSYTHTHQIQDSNWKVEKTGKIWQNMHWLSTTQQNTTIVTPRRFHRKRLGCLHSPLVGIVSVSFHTGLFSLSQSLPQVAHAHWFLVDSTDSHTVWFQTSRHPSQAGTSQVWPRPH